MPSSGKHITGKPTTLPAGDAVDVVWNVHHKKYDLIGHEYLVGDGANIYLVAFFRLSDSKTIDNDAQSLAETFAFVP